MEWYAVLSVGITLVLFGSFFLVRHRSAIQSISSDADFNSKQSQFLVAQQKRRFFTTCLVIAVGILIPLSYYAIDPLKNMMLATTLLLALLGLILVICIMAVSDIMSSRYLREDIDLKRAETELKRRMLEQELERHQTMKQEQQRSDPRRNGH